MIPRFIADELVSLLQRHPAVGLVCEGLVDQWRQIMVIIAPGFELIQRVNQRRLL
jgi:hypothetical protein